MSANAINEYFEPLYRWFIGYRLKHGYPVGWGEEDLSEKVLHRKAGKFESGQERSGILKTNNKGISLSINIPSPLALGGTKGDATKNNDVQTERGNDESVSVPMLDLAKLLSSGDRFSVSTTETSANTKDGATTISNKEFNLNNEEDNAQSPSQDENRTSNATQNSFTGKDAAAAKATNASSSTDNNKTASIVANATNAESHNGSANVSSTEQPAANITLSNHNNATSANKTNATPINQTLEWQKETLAKENNALINQTASHDAPQNSTTENATAVQNATTRNISPCPGEKRSLGALTGGDDCYSDIESKLKTISVSPSELIQHVLMKKVKSIVQKTLPQANVQKTKTGFTVNLDLNAKDEIPSRSEPETGKTRQQHVNVFIAPKGVVVKPKSSEQLMKPSFVPVQNKDNLELRDGK